MVRRLIAALLLPLLLAACAGGPVTDARPLTGARLSTSAVRSATGVSLPLYSWAPAGPPKAVILALHGYGDSAEGTFRWAADAWAKEGILTYAYDQRGFGANPDRKQWPGPDRLIADAKAVAAAVRRAHPGVPLTVLGHSMGGGVVLAAAGQGLEADRLVLVAPAIAGGRQLDPVRRIGGWGLGVFAADRRFTGDGVVDLYPTDNIERLREVASGPYHYADPSGRELYGLVQLMDRAASAAPSVTVPTLTLMGAKDEYLRPSAVRAVHETIPGAAGYRLYAEGWHWLLRDIQAPRVWEDVARFALAP